jgi:hypothetical protein
MAATPIKSIKGMDANMRCRGFQFEVGKTYEAPGDIEACSSGFHACPVDRHPLSVFDYYPPAENRYFEVEQSGEIHAKDDKLASAKITINAELSVADLTKRAVEWVFARAKWGDGPVASGNNEGATASGDQGAATASGDQGAATALGYQGAATASGDQGAATASGNRGAATASGRDGRVRGIAGAALFAVERDGYGNIVSVSAGIVGRGGIAPNVWYTAKDGKLVPAPE